MITLLVYTCSLVHLVSLGVPRISNGYITEGLKRLLLSSDADQVGISQRTSDLTSHSATKYLGDSLASTSTGIFASNVVRAKKSPKIQLPIDKPGDLKIWADGRAPIAQPAAEDVLQELKDLVDKCEKLINSDKVIGPMNSNIEKIDLIDIAPQLAPIDELQDKKSSTAVINKKAPRRGRRNVVLLEVFNFVHSVARGQISTLNNKAEITDPRILGVQCLEKCLEYSLQQDFKNAKIAAENAQKLLSGLDWSGDTAKPEELQNLLKSVRNKKAILNAFHYLTPEKLYEEVLKIKTWRVELSFPDIQAPLESTWVTRAKNVANFSKIVKIVVGVMKNEKEMLESLIGGGTILLNTNLLAAQKLMTEAGELLGTESAHKKALKELAASRTYQQQLEELNETYRQFKGKRAVRET